MSTRPRATFSKQQRELAQKDRAAKRANRREDRKARALERAASGQTGPEMGEALPPMDSEPTPPGEGAVAEAPRLSAREELGTRLYVGNLSFSTGGDQVRELFATIGEVADVHVVMDRDTGRPRGFAFVTMRTGLLARQAIRELDGALLDDRPLRVSQAEERQDRGGPRGGGGFGGGGRRRF